MTRGMTFMLWMVTTEAFTRSTKGATEAPGASYRLESALSDLR